MKKIILLAFSLLSTAMALQAQYYRSFYFSSSPIDVTPLQKGLVTKYSSPGHFLSGTDQSVINGLNLFITKTDDAGNVTFGNSFQLSFQGNVAAVHTAHSLEMADGSGYVVCGSFSYVDQAQNITRYALYLVKFNTSGTPVLQKVYFLTSPDLGQVDAYLELRSVTISNKYNNELYITGEVIPYNTEHKHFFVGRLKDDGTISWLNTYSFTDLSYVHDIIESPHTPEVLVLGHRTDPSLNVDKGTLFFFDEASGNFNFAKEYYNNTYGSPAGWSRFTAISEAMDSPGGFIIGGTTDRSATAVNFWVTRIDMSGNIVWSRILFPPEEFVACGRLKDIKQRYNQSNSTYEYFAYGEETPNDQNCGGINFQDMVLIVYRLDDMGHVQTNGYYNFRDFCGEKGDIAVNLDFEEDPSRLGLALYATVFTNTVQHVPEMFKLSFGGLFGCEAIISDPMDEDINLAETDIVVTQVHYFVPNDLDIASVDNISSQSECNADQVPAYQARVNHQEQLQISSGVNGLSMNSVVLTVKGRKDISPSMANYEIYDLLGRVVLKGTVELSNKPVIISTSAIRHEGLYLIKVDSGQLSSSQLIRINH